MGVAKIVRLEAENIKGIKAVDITAPSVNVIRITGANEQQQKIAMTTPVFMSAEDEGDEGEMGFVMPRAVAAQGLPQPSSDSVQIRKRTGGRFAVIRFSGRLDAESVAQSESRLRARMEARGLPAEGDMECAGYDPPWTPGPLRRNEVLLRLE